MTLRRPCATIDTCGESSSGSLCSWLSPARATSGSGGRVAAFELLPPTADGWPFPPAQTQQWRKHWRRVQGGCAGGSSSTHEPPPPRVYALSDASAGTGEMILTIAASLTHSLADGVAQELWGSNTTAAHDAGFVNRSLLPPSARAAFCAASPGPLCLLQPISGCAAAHAAEVAHPSSSVHPQQQQPQRPQQRPRQRLPLPLPCEGLLVASPPSWSSAAATLHATPPLGHVFELSLTVAALWRLQPTLQLQLERLLSAVQPRVPPARLASERTKRADAHHDAAAGSTSTSTDAANGRSSRSAVEQRERWVGVHVRRSDRGWARPWSDFVAAVASLRARYPGVRYSAYVATDSVEVAAACAAERNFSCVADADPRRRVLDASIVAPRVWQVSAATPHLWLCSPRPPTTAARCHYLPPRTRRAHARPRVHALSRDGHECRSWWVKLLTSVAPVMTCVAHGVGGRRRS